MEAFTADGQVNRNAWRIATQTKASRPSENVALYLAGRAASHERAALTLRTCLTGLKLCSVFSGFSQSRCWPCGDR